MAYKQCPSLSNNSKIVNNYFIFTVSFHVKAIFLGMLWTSAYFRTPGHGSNMFRPKAVTPVRMEQLCLLWEYNDDDGKNYDDDRIMTIMLIDIKNKYH